MAGKTINMSKVKQILRLYSNGVPIQSIAKAMSTSRNTVKKYLHFIQEKKLDSGDLLSMDDHSLEALFQQPDASHKQRYDTLISLFPSFEKELLRTGVTRWVLWNEYRERYPDGYSYTQFCDHYRHWQQSRSGTLHFEHQPGDKLFIDFTGKKLSIADAETGEIIPVEIYVAVLGYSQLTYVEAIPSQQKEDFIHATENALHFFGGVPRVLVPDNLKSAVQKADKYEAELNTSFLDFGNHYATSILPARSYKPRDKALVEKAVNIVYSRIFAPLRNQVFHSLPQLNKAIGEQLSLHNNHPFQGRAESRRQLFEQQEKQLLQPLATDRYELKQIKEVTVMKNGYVQLYEYRQYYSVPYRYIGCKIKMIYSSTQVSIYYNRERIAWHKKAERRHAYVTVKDHLSSTHQFVTEWNPEKFIGWAAAIAPVVKDYIARVLENATHPEQAYRSCVGILSLDKKAGRDRLIKAVERATWYGAFNYTMIKKILDSGLDRIPLEDEHGLQTSLPLHENIRGPQHYQ